MAVCLLKESAVLYGVTDCLSAEGECSPVGCEWLSAEGECSPIGCEWLFVQHDHTEKKRCGK